MLKKISDVVLTGLVISLISILRILPAALSLRLARFYVGILKTTIPKLSSSAIRNLEIAYPNSSDEERGAILVDSFERLARHLFWFSRSKTLTSEKAQTMSDYKEAVQTLKDLKRDKGNGKGTLLVGLHYGPFEYGIQLFCLLYGPCKVLARGSGLPLFDKWWTTRRDYFGHSFFSRKGGYRQVIKHLNEGEDVVVLFDQNIKSNHAVFVDFFGLPAATTKAVALAAIRTGAPVALTGIRELTPGRFEVFTTHVELPQDDSKSHDEIIKDFTQTLAHVAEQEIRKQPSSWFWVHRRWKTRPPGEPETIYS